jgi:hypothetical protein
MIESMAFRSALLPKSTSSQGDERAYVHGRDLRHESDVISGMTSHGHFTKTESVKRCPAERPEVWVVGLP